MGRTLEQVIDDLPPERRAKIERRAARLMLEAVHEMSDGGSTPEIRLKSPEDPQT
jgi:hypothetical protein